MAEEYISIIDAIGYSLEFQKLHDEKKNFWMFYVSYAMHSYSFVIHVYIISTNRRRRWSILVKSIINNDCMQSFRSYLRTSSTLFVLDFFSTDRAWFFIRCDQRHKIEKVTLEIPWQIVIKLLEKVGWLGLVSLCNKSKN